MTNVKNLSVAIIGYGKMGKEIENVSLEAGHNITCIIDNDDDWLKYESWLKKSDVAIEFTTPETVVDNIKKCFDIGVPVVTGTTGWQSQINEISELCNEKNQTLFYASNFSLGVNILFELNKKLAQIMSNLNDYSLEIEEVHHTQKLDSPSGTAVCLANDIIKINKKFNNWKLIPENITEYDIPIKAIRKNNIFGVHEISYKSGIDSIKLSHSAANRKGFAKGAITAAEWVVNKKGVYTMQDMLKF